MAANFTVEQVATAVLSGKIRRNEVEPCSEKNKKCLLPLFKDSESVFLEEGVRLLQPLVESSCQPSVQNQPHLYSSKILADSSIHAINCIPGRSKSVAERYLPKASWQAFCENTILCRRDERYTLPVTSCFLFYEGL
jgi:hypothetical protein